MEPQNISKENSPKQVCYNQESGNQESGKGGNGDRPPVLYAYDLFSGSAHDVLPLWIDNHQPEGSVIPSEMKWSEGIPWFNV